jgi:hypothetical protein
MPHHVLRDRHLIVDLAIVNLEGQANKVGQNGRRSCLRSDRRRPLAYGNLNDWETVWTVLGKLSKRVCEKFLRDNIRSYSALALRLNNRIEVANDIPFQMDRARSALLGNMMSLGRYQISKQVVDAGNI